MEMRGTQASSFVIGALLSAVQLPKAVQVLTDAMRALSPLSPPTVTPREPEAAPVRATFDEKLASLVKHLHDNTPLTVTWHGPSPAFRNWAEETRGGCPIQSKRSMGTVRELALDALSKFAGNCTGRQKDAVLLALEEHKENDLLPRKPTAPRLPDAETRRTVYNALEQFHTEHPYEAPSASYLARFKVDPRTDLFALTATVRLVFPVLETSNSYSPFKQPRAAGGQPLQLTFDQVAMEPLTRQARERWIAECCGPLSLKAFEAFEEARAVSRASRLS